MNNSRIVHEGSEEDGKALFLEKQQGELAQIVEAINQVETSEKWQKLKKLLLDGIVTNLERQLASEAAEDEVDLPKIYKLQGELKWARRYSDLKKLSEAKRQQIENIKNQIKNETNPRDGAL